MNFSGRLFLLILALLFLAEIVGCQRQISPEEKAARTELRLALGAKHWESAISLARRVLEFSPGDDGSWAQLARAQIGIRDVRGLEQTLDDWSRHVARRSFKFDEYRGDLAHLEGRPQEALAEWEKAVANKGREARLFVKIARAEQANRKWQEAALAWSRALATRESAEVLLKRAACYHLHSWTAELADLRRAKALAPDQPFVRQELARFDRLAKFLEEVQELDRQQLASPNDASLLGDRALLFLRAGDPVLALDDAEAAAKISPTAVRPQLFRAIARQELDGSSSKSPPASADRLEDFSPQFLETIARLDAEIAAEPTNAELLTSRAWQLNETGQPGFALVDARKAQASDPKSAGACAEAAYALSKLDQHLSAYQDIERANQLDPKSATAWQYRGELEMAQGDCAQAVESLTRALEINQTAAALTARESCYRKLGLTDKAEEDQKSLEQFRQGEAKESLR
jgi:tetratricopeptide (TPR) repeat protein